MSNNQCPATSKHKITFAKCIYFMKKVKFGGHLGRHLKFLKTLKGAEPAPDGILKSNVSSLRKYQNIYYTLPCHVVLGISQTTKGGEGYLSVLVFRLEFQVQIFQVVCKNMYLLCISL